jgi:NAD(P)-dependent dehydrogenase (short-subunit alcohol dehydrogenase family)
MSNSNGTRWQGRGVVVVEAARTPIGRGHHAKGWFRGVHPNELLGAAYRAVSGSIAADERHHQPWGLAHGGLYATAIETFAVAAAADAASDVSILVNNAGISLATPVLQAPLSDIRDELETNLFGIIRVARAFAPVLAQRPPTSMVNVLSVLSWLAFGRGYEISKAAAWSATNSLRLALREQGTTVNALHVGYIDTDMAARIDAPKADPRDVARQTADAIIAGDFETLADDTTRSVKSQLSDDVTALYVQLAAA